MSSGRFPIIFRSVKPTRCAPCKHVGVQSLCALFVESGVTGTEFPRDGDFLLAWKNSGTGILPK